MAKKKNQPATNVAAGANETPQKKRNVSAFFELLNTEKFVETSADVANKLEGQKISIYRKSVFEGLSTPKELKKKRSELRGTFKDYTKKFFQTCQTKDNTQIAAFLNKFIAYYKQTYVTNDFSLNSISSSEKTKSEESTILFMQAAKLFAAENSEKQ